MSAHSFWFWIHKQNKREWLLQIAYRRNCLTWQQNHSVGCTKSKDRHTVSRSCLFWSSVFATICPLKNPIFLNFWWRRLKSMIYVYILNIFRLYQLLLVCLLHRFLLLYLSSCTWRRQFSVESACVSLFPFVSSYRWVHIPISFISLTISCSLIPQKKNVFFHIHEITRVLEVFPDSVWFHVIHSGVNYDHPIVINIHKLYSESIQDGNEIVFDRIPRHVGISGNFAMPLMAISWMNTPRSLTGIHIWIITSLSNSSKQTAQDAFLQLLVYFWFFKTCSFSHFSLFFFCLISFDFNCFCFFVFFPFLYVSCSAKQYYAYICTRRRGEEMEYGLYATVNSQYDFFMKMKLVKDVVVSFL